MRHHSRHAEDGRYVEPDCLRSQSRDEITTLAEQTEKNTRVVVVTPLSRFHGASGRLLPVVMGMAEIDNERHKEDRQSTGFERKS